MATKPSKKSVKKPAAAVKQPASSQSTISPSAAKKSSSATPVQSAAKSDKKMKATPPVTSKASPKVSASTVKTTSKPAASKVQAKPASKPASAKPAVTPAVKKMVTTATKKWRKSADTLQKNSGDQKAVAVIRDVADKMDRAVGQPVKQASVKKTEKQEIKKIVKSGVKKIVKAVAKKTAAPKAPGVDLAKKVLGLGKSEAPVQKELPPWEAQFRTASPVAHPAAPAVPKAIVEQRAESGQQASTTGISMSDAARRLSTPAVFSPATPAVVKNGDGTLNFGAMIGNR